MLVPQWIEDFNEVRMTPAGIMGAATTMGIPRSVVSMQMDLLAFNKLLSKVYPAKPKVVAIGNPK